MCVAYSPGIAALARGVLGNLAAPSFAPTETPLATRAADGSGVGADRAVILRGGPILTIDGARPVAEALAIRGSKILAVGSATEVKRHYTAATEIVDLEGRAVLPGFVEPHVQVVSSALAAAGIGSDAADLFRDAPDRVAELLRALARDADAPVRVRGAFTPELATALGAAPGAGDERYDVVGIAYWADGSVQDFTAALDEPYLEGRGTGRLNHEEHQLCEAMRAWHHAGWQLVVHSNGDRASEQVLRCFEEILAPERLQIAGVCGEGAAFESGGPAGVRHRIEHFTVASDEQAARAAALGLSLSHTINHVYFWGETFRDHVLGVERAAQIHALARDVEHGICSSCHSDSPVSPVDPLLALRTATTRLMRDSDDVLGPFQQLDLAQALRTVTCNPARQVLLGDRVGTLRPGMLADLVVLDRDPREVAPERLHELQVLETWLGGRRQRWYET
jgi:predicted amidohydrolase YtcJ